MIGIPEVPSVIPDSGKMFKTSALGSDSSVFSVRLFADCAVDRKSKKKKRKKKVELDLELCYILPLVIIALWHRKIACLGHTYTFPLLLDYLLFSKFLLYTWYICVLSLFAHFLKNHF